MKRVYLTYHWKNSVNNHLRVHICALYMSDVTFEGIQDVLKAALVYRITLFQSIETEKWERTCGARSRAIRWKFSTTEEGLDAKLGVQLDLFLRVLYIQ